MRKTLLGKGGAQRCAPLLLVALSLLLNLGAAAPAAAVCHGDCDQSGSVTISELLLGVQLALSDAAPASCAAMDANLDARITIEDLVRATATASGGCPVPLPTPIFPADYRASFVEVRNCRIGLDHDGYAIRVLTDPASADAYRNNQNPLPVGSVIIKEEYDDATCDNQAKLVRWSVMRKEEPGFDVDGDWRWQKTLRDGTVIFNDKSSCIGCHRAPACTARDYMCTEEILPVPRVVLGGLPAALLSITGTSATDVYAVGADPGIDDFGPYVLNYNGVRWQRLRPPTSGALWWISTTPIDGAFYLAGEQGVILRFDLTTRQFSTFPTPGRQTMFGIWGESADDIWAVGGDPSAGEDEGGVLWHYDGSSWQVQDLSGVRAAGIPVLFKVWGRSADDVYVVGQRGVILHYDGSTWQQMVSNSVRPLFTVHGNATDTVAVGGFGDGVILEREGNEFVDRTPAFAKQTNGVFIRQQGGGVSAGNEGEYSYRIGSGWQIQDPPVNTLRDFHATWVDPEGGVWAVGGDLSIDLNNGVLAYGGTRTISTQIVDIDPCIPMPIAGPTTVSFATQIAPLLTDTGCKAAGCHIGAFAASAYNMTTYAGIFKQGVLAKSLKLCPVVPGNPDTSFLVEKLGATQRPGGGTRMPPGAATPLTSEQVGLLRTWILEGAQNN